MSELVAAVVLVTGAVLAGVLVPVLLQLRKTLASAEKLFDSARGNLGQITTDVHEIRKRIDTVADSIDTKLNQVSTLTGALAEVGGTIRGFSSAFAAGGSSIAGFLSSLGTLVSFFASFRKGGRS